MQQYFDTLTDDSGNSLLGATVTVTNYPSGTAATIYSTNGTTQPIANNTVSADITGQISFFAPDGAYTLTYAYKGTNYKVRSPVQILDPMGFVTATDGGASANNYAVTSSAYPAQKYVGLKLEIQAAHTNTGASTLVYQGDAGFPINQPGGSALVGGMLQANGYSRLEWDGTEWQLIGSQSQPFYATTAAETAASVSPANNAYPVGYIERYGGGVGLAASFNDTALAAANAVMGQQGGGTIYALGQGVYTFANSYNLSRYIVLQGGGYGTTFQYTGSSSFLTINSTSGRVDIRELQILGTGNTGTGLVLGDSSGNAGQVRLFKLLFSKFNLGMRMGGATWLTCQKCEFGNAAGNSLGVITNNIGIDFNYFGSNNYSSSLLFEDCVVSNNATAGVQATNTSINMNEVVWINCNVQNNCQSATANPQFYMGNVVGFTIDNLYMEYVLGGTAPPALRSDNLNNGRIHSLYVNTAAYGIRDFGGGAMNHVEIAYPFITGIVTAAISCASETDVRLKYPSISGSITLTGTGVEQISSSFLTASWPTNEASFSPAIAFGTSGSITQTVVGATYSQVGNIVTFSFRISWTTITSPTGTVTVTGLPVTAKNGAADVALTVISSALTFSGVLVAFLGNNTSVVQLYSEGATGTTAALQGSAFAANGFLIVSGSYQV